MLSSVFTRTIRDRWLGALGGGVAIALCLLASVAVYASIDTSFYYELPPAFLEAFVHGVLARAAAISSPLRKSARCSEN